MILCVGIHKNYELQEKIQANGKNNIGFWTEFLFGAVSFYKRQSSMSLEWITLL